jgi:DNA-binding response OmpR family regulator
MNDIVIVEDSAADNQMLTALVRPLTSGEVVQAYTRQEGDRLIKGRSFSLAIVDLDLGPEPAEVFSKYGGFDLLNTLVQLGTPTIIVSGTSEENLPKVATALKAFDFVSKPISEPEFINKVKHALEAPHSATATEQAWPKNLQPDPKNNPGVLWKGKPVRLSLTQYRLLNKLISQPGVPVPNKVLAQAMGTTDSDGALAVHITWIRKRFKDSDSTFKLLRNVPGRGYAWTEE